MSGTIADSIIIRVGHGIMIIPRDHCKSKQHEVSSDNKGQLKEALKEN